MDQNKLNILIVGDELGLGESFRLHFEKLGHKAAHASRSDEALPLLSAQSQDYIFVDCMLQGGMNGIDLAQHIRANFKIQKNAQYILMSAVFTDKAFVTEALEKTGALSFIEKKHPFDLNSLDSLIAQKKKIDESAMIRARKLLYEMFSKETVSTREKRKVIESLDEVSGFDLPFIYSLLVETRSSGYLNIYEADGSVSGISFSDGHIVGVDSEDKTTYIGEMLIQSGYANIEDVTSALSERTNMKIGSRLITSNLLSPHAFDLILTEQMNLRLSRMISEQKIKVNFAAVDVEKTQPNIDSDQLQYFLHDWIASKLSEGWLKSLYMMWASNSIQLSPQFSPDHPALQMGLVKALPGFVDQIRGGATLNMILIKKTYPEAMVYKGLHFLLTKGLIVFGARMAYRNELEQQAALKKVWNDIQDKENFEILDFLGAENCSGENLDKLTGPQPKDPQSPAAVLWKKIRTKIEEATQVSTNQQMHDKFKQNVANKNAEAKLHASQKMEEAKKALGLNQYGRALVLLQEVQKSAQTMEQLHLFLAWAKTGMIDPTKKAIQLKEIEMDLVQVPAEERYDAHYPMVIGMFCRAKGDFVNAKKSLEKALALDSTLIAARRELSALETQAKKSQDIFSMVGGLFGKKSS